MTAKDLRVMIVGNLSRFHDQCCYSKEDALIYGPMIANELERSHLIEELESWNPEKENSCSFEYVCIMYFTLVKEMLRNTDDTSKRVKDKKWLASQCCKISRVIHNTSGAQDRKFANLHAVLTEWIKLIGKDIVIEDVMTGCSPIVPYSGTIRKPGEDALNLVGDVKNSNANPSPRSPKICQAPVVKCLFPMEINSIEDTILTLLLRFNVAAIQNDVPIMNNRDFMDTIRKNPKLGPDWYRIMVYYYYRILKRDDESFSRVCEALCGMDTEELLKAVESFLKEE